MEDAASALLEAGRLITAGDRELIAIVTGPALNTASSMNAYLLVDRATWIAFNNRGALAILVESDDCLFNQYGVILVNPNKHPHVKQADGQAFIDWLRSAEGQKAIASYQVHGEQLFFPNAGQSGS